VWKDWGLPSVASVAASAGLTQDPVDSVWLSELNYLAPRAYVFTPYWGETADPVLRRALEKASLNPVMNLRALLEYTAQQAQAALDKRR
jgi:hypothetical protein